jgi:non-specific serine/threonine protein kinase/serine/threonine-protein kinase
MTAPERYKRVKQIFQSALEVEPQGRASFIDGACAGDQGLRAEVESLLSHHDEAGSFIELSAFEVAARAIERQEDELAPGRMIGPYRIVSEIARGGMGTVYLATRADDQYKKQVAIKLIKRGMDTEFIVRRFLSERQILANLDHENIARLLDGGTTTDGLPYFVMEYIEGRPIDRYANERKLSTVERLKLFRQVCSTISYAHQNLVIHRDIKPSNVLITESGAVKLLDFGIAKLLGPDPAAQTIEATDVAVRMMTPEYASPEQVRGEPMTTASDVYSLGVVLYELLTGHRPYLIKNRLPHEIVQIVCHIEPERPSASVSRPASGGAPSAIETARLRRRLSGDLDNIVMMALRKEPGRRYSSVEQLADDIRRHVEGLPVIARKDTFSYRAGKFISRNRAAVAVAAIIVLTLVGGIVATAWQASVARGQRAKAERRFNDVRKLASSVLFNYHDQIKNLSGATPVREMLVKDGLAYLDSLAAEADDNPSLQFELAAAYMRVGDIQGGEQTLNLGDTAGALESYKKAVAIMESLVTRGHKKLPIIIKEDADTRWDLATAHYRVGVVLESKGDTAGALDHQRKTHELFQMLLGEDPESNEGRKELAISYGRLASLQDAAGDNDAAKENFALGIELFESLMAQDPENLELRREASLINNNFGRALARNSDPAGAIIYYQKALAIEEATAAKRGVDAQSQSDLAYMYNNIGNAMARLGDFKNGLEYLRKGLAAREAVVASDPKSANARHRLAVSTYQLGGAMVRSGDLAAGIENHRKAVTILEALHQVDPANAAVQGDLAYVYSLVANTLVRMAESEKTRAADKPAHWRDARGWYQKSLIHWTYLRDRGALVKQDEKEPERIAGEIAKCDNALSR